MSRRRVLRTWELVVGFSCAIRLEKIWRTFQTETQVNNIVIYNI